MSVQATITARDAAGRRWDAIVIGAGVAGSAAALVLARQGRSVLLVDKATFPREKVCGCCLNASALQAIERLAPGVIGEGEPAAALDSFSIFAGWARASVRIRPGRAISRAALDAALVRAAVAQGVAFLPPTTARVLSDGADHAEVALGDGECVARTALVLAADGLAGRSLDGLAGFDAVTRRNSRFGASAIFDDSAITVPPGSICMYMHRRGYVGLVRLEDGRLNAAAAFDPAFAKDMGGPAPAAAQVLQEAAGMHVDEVTHAHWHGTPLLTRRRSRVQGRRVLVLGDAAGYVEPFTGEGMSWALSAAEAAARLVEPHLARGEVLPEGAWTRELRQLLRGRQHACRALSLLMRSPAVPLTVRLLSMFPALARPLVHHIDRPPLLEAAS